MRRHTCTARAATLRGAILVLLLITTGVSVGFAQFRFGYSSIPLEGGAQTEASVGYGWDDAFASSIRVVSAQTAVASEIDGFPDSLLFSEEERLEAVLNPLELSLGMGFVQARFGLGGVFNRRGVLERGNFVFSDPQVFRNEYAADRLGVAGSADVALRLPLLSVDYRTTIIPLYWFTLAQEISIQPLVATDESYETSAAGGFAWDQNLRLTIGRFFQLEGEYNLDRLTLELLTLASDGGQYVFQPAESDALVQTVRAFVNGRIPFGGGAGLSVGVGYEWGFVSSQNDVATTQLETGRWSYKVQFVSDL